MVFGESEMVIIDEASEFSQEAWAALDTGTEARESITG